MHLTSVGCHGNRVILLGHLMEKGEYYLMTCHHRENVHIRSPFENILKLMAATERKIYFPASYRTQKVLKEYRLSVPNNVIMVDPIGYNEMLTLMVKPRASSAIWIPWWKRRLSCRFPPFKCAQPPSVPRCTIAAQA